MTIDFLTDLEIDITKPSLHADVELDIDGKDSASDVARQAGYIEKYAPRFISYGVGLTIPASPSAGFQFVSDSPNDGRRVEIRRFHLDLAQPIGAVEPSGVVIYLVSDPGNLAGFAAQFLHSKSVIKKYTSLPIDDTWGSHEAVVFHPENIYVVATQTGGTPIQLAGNLQCTDFAVDEFTEPQMVYHLVKNFDGKR